MKNRYYFIFILLVILTSSCQNSSDSPKEISFYHWKSNFALTNDETDYLDVLAVKKIYIRFFDVDWSFPDQQAQPLSILQSTQEFPSQTEIIPTVFITNRCFEQLSQGAIPTFARKIKDKITEISLRSKLKPVSEIQMDCDWSLSTQKKYFYFLNILKELLGPGRQLSATIRLHQYKYPEKTGVPPVSKGVLMFYNMASLNDPQTINSILDLKVARQYLEGSASYPLPLDVALPIFQWGVLKRRGKVIDLLHPLQKIELNGNQQIESQSPSQYRVRRSHYFKERYLYPGDIIRLEEIQVKELKASFALLEAYLRPRPEVYIFYHLYSESPSQFPQDSIRYILE